MDLLDNFVTIVNNFLYGMLLIAMLLVCGLFFSVSTRFVQFRYFFEIFKVIFEKKSDMNGVSSFQALMVSTASRVGTGNIVGVSAAICMGGYGAVPWMWLIAVLGMASAFAETVLAQIFKKSSQRGCYGGPAYYIEYLAGNRLVPLLFIFSLIATFMVGFNMLASYNLQDAFSGFDFYDRETSPYVHRNHTYCNSWICFTWRRTSHNKIYNFFCSSDGAGLHYYCCDCSIESS